MDTGCIKTSVEKILPFRALFLQENNVQIRYNACHERRWSDSYLLTLDGVGVGYGSVKGLEELSDRDAVFEFYVVPGYRKLAVALFAGLVRVSGAPFIECQSNDRLLSPLMEQFAENIQAEAILFQDKLTTEFRRPELVFRKRKETDNVFKHTLEPVGDYVLEQDGGIVATGGFMLHYNPPFADLYMEVRRDRRRQGLGSFLLQELKKACYLSGRVPAARCNIRNKASAATLKKAGFEEAGRMLRGAVRGEALSTK